ncbi:hypothetical protein N9R76_01075 [Planktomarina temperata]|nr:hypothetical protein [Planktomarina temperata]
MLKTEIIKMVIVSTPMVLTPAFNLFFLVLAAQIIDLKQYGSLSFCLALTSILIGFSDLGFRDYFLSKDGQTKSYCNSFNLLAISIFIFTIIFFIQWHIVNQDKIIILLFTLLSVEALALGTLHKATYYIYQTENNLAKFSKYDIYFKTIPAIIKVTVLYSSENLHLSIALSSSISLISYTLWIVSIRRKISPDPSKLGEEIRDLCKDIKSWATYTISFMSFFLCFGADKLIVKYMLGMEKLAIYSASMVLMSVGQIFVTTLWSLYMPRLSRNEKLWSYSEFLKVVCTLSAVLVAGYILTAKYLFHYIYPSQYADGSIVLIIASFYFLFRFPNVIIEIFYITESKYQKFVAMRVISGILSLALSFLLLPRIGISGSAVALVISEMMLTFALVYYRNKSGRAQ